MEPLMNGHRGGTVGGGGGAATVAATGKAVTKAGDAAIADVFPAPPNPSISKANVRDCDPKEARTIPSSAIVNENEKNGTNGHCKIFFHFDFKYCK